MNSNCLFCKIKDKWIFENEYFYSIFDINPVSPGHALVISKSHVESFLDLNQDQWLSLKSAISETVKIIKETNFENFYKNLLNDGPTEKSIYFYQKMLVHESITRKPDGYNIGVNDGGAAGRTIHHLHIQIIPRFSGDTKNPTGGIRNVIPGLGDYLN